MLFLLHFVRNKIVIMGGHRSALDRLLASLAARHVCPPFSIFTFLLLFYGE